MLWRWGCAAMERKHCETNTHFRFESVVHSQTYSRRVLPRSMLDACVCVGGGGRYVAGTASQRNWNEWNKFIARVIELTSQVRPCLPCSYILHSKRYPNTAWQRWLVLRFGSQGICLPSRECVCVCVWFACEYARIIQFDFVLYWCRRVFSMFF